MMSILPIATLSARAAGRRCPVSTAWSGTFSANAGTPASMGSVTATDPGGMTVGAYWNGAVHAAYGAINWYGSTVRASVFTAPELANLEIYYKAKAGL